MGFWSAVGSAFSSVGRAVGSAISGAARAIGGAARAVGSALVSATKSTVSFLANKAKSWGNILKETAKGALVGGLQGYRNGGWLGGLFGAVAGGFKSGRNEYLRQQMEPEQEDEILEEEQYGNQVEVDHEVEQLAELMTAFIPALQRKFADRAPVESFEEYLRIDISMRLIHDLIKKISKMKSPTEITSADRRLIRLIDKLALDKPISDAELQDFDDLIKQRYSKSLLLMGSERLFSLWTQEEETCRQEVNVNRTEMTRANLRIKELESRVRYNLPLTEQESVEFADIKQRAQTSMLDYDKARQYLEKLRLVTGVCEGLLQQAEADDKGERIREQDRRRTDKAGAILVNMERELEKIRDTGQLGLQKQDEEFMRQYVDMYITDAVKRKNKIGSEFVEISV